MLQKWKTLIAINKDFDYPHLLLAINCVLLENKKAQRSSSTLSPLLRFSAIKLSHEAFSFFYRRDSVKDLSSTSIYCCYPLGLVFRVKNPVFRGWFYWYE